MINLITAMVRKVYGGWWSGGVVEWWSGMTATSETKLWELVNVVNVVPKYCRNVTFSFLISWLEIQQC